MLKQGKTTKALQEYFRAYYNDHMLRNYRFLFDKTQYFMKDGKRIEYDATSLKASKYGEKDDSLTRAPKWLMKNSRRKYGTLAGEITYFKTLAEYKEDNIIKRYCDRLFFDFDIERNPYINQLKEEFKQANFMLEGRELRDKYVELQRRFKDLIFNQNMLRDIFNEAKSLCEYLQRFNVKPFLVFSGFKGFHVNVFFDELQLKNLSEISKTLARTYSKELGLHYLDFNVLDRERAHKRLQRVQYSTHSKTGLITRPLPLDITYDELLTTIQSRKRHPPQFDFEEMKAPAGFNRMLMTIENEVSFNNKEREKQLEKENKAKRLQLEKKYGKNYKGFNEIDLRDIASAYGIDGKREANKTIVNCCFHHDVHPSAVIYPERFYCSTCGISLNYYEFISRLENTTDKHEIIEIARRFL